MSPAPDMDDHEPALKVRRRSIAILARCISDPDDPTENGSRRHAAETGVVRCTTSAADLMEIREKMASIRKSTSGGKDPADALLARLETREPTLDQLHRTGVGREVSKPFWRDSDDDKIKARCRGLLAQWRTLAMPKPTTLKSLRRLKDEQKPRTGDMKFGETTQDGKIDSKNQKWEEAWQEVAAARCARDIEGAFWYACATDSTSASECSAGPEAICDGTGSKAYRAKVRSLATSLKQPENTSLRSRALQGDIIGSDLFSC